MALATLSIDLVAKLATFEQQLGQAVAISERQAARIEGAFSKVGTTIKGLGIAAAVAFTVKDAIERLGAAIDTLDRIDDLSEKFGIAAESLSAYRFASEVAGTSTEELVVGLNKLSKNMAAAAGGSKEQAAAFKTIGVAVTESNGALRSADEVLLDIATKFSGYEDSAAKAALAQELFGKSGAALIPLLNKGREGITDLRGEASKLGAVFSDEAAKAAGDFNDNLKRLRLTLDGITVALAGDLLPTLQRFTDELLEGRKAFGGFAKAFVELTLFTSPFDTYAESAEKARDKIGELRNAIQNVRDRAARGGFTGADQQFLDQAERNLDSLTRKLQYFERLSIKVAGENVPEGLKDTRGGNGRTDAPIVPSAPAAANKDLERAAKLYSDLIAKITERTSATQFELDTGEKLSEQQKFALDVVTDLAKAESHLSDTQKRGIASSLEAYLVKAKALDVQTESTKLIQAESRALAGEVTQREIANRGLREYIEEIGLTDRELEELRLTRLEHALAIEQEKVATLALFDATAPNLAQMRQANDLLAEELKLRRQAVEKKDTQARSATAGALEALKEFSAEAESVGEGTKNLVKSALDGLEDNLAEFITKGKADWKSYFDNIIQQALKLYVIRPILNSIFTGLGSLLSGGGAANAAGGVYGPEGRMNAYAAGGVVTGPTWFRGGDGSANLMGEAGIEGIFPLKRGPDGKLGVSATGGQGNVTNIYQVAAGVQRNELVAAMQIVSQQMDAKVSARMRRNGLT